MRRRLRLLVIDLEAVHHAGIKHEEPDALLTFKTKGTNKTKLEVQQSVLMLSEIEKEEEVGTEHLDQDDPNNGRYGNQKESHRKETQPPTST